MSWLELQLALGVQWMPYVGPDASLARFDPVQGEGVRLPGTALEAQLDLPWLAVAQLRLEEGVFHAGAVEASELTLGVEHPVVGLWIGRNDLPVTRDRLREPDARALTVETALGRVLLPQHAGGAGLELRWPDRASVQAGVSYPSLASDAPYLWGQASVHPLGELPEREDASVDGWLVALTGGGLRLDSPSLGELVVLSGAVELRRGPGLLFVEHVRTLDERAQLTAGLGGAWGRAHALLRGERVLALEEDEIRRDLLSLRLAWSPDPRVQLYAEGQLARETPEALADVVVLDTQRDNDWLGIGMRAWF